LALIDFVWNAWHFASQHAGVLRIYARKVGGGVPWLERWGLRLFVTYAALRAAGLAAGWSEGDGNPLAALHALDWLTLVTPASLLVTNLAGFRRDRVGKFTYLLSVCGLYTGLLASVHSGSAVGVVSFAAAGSMVHAVEYLAIVTHYARRRAGGGPSAFRSLVRSWAAFLEVYVVALGSAGSWLSQPEHGVAAAWQASPRVP